MRMLFTSLSLSEVNMGLIRAESRRRERWFRDARSYCLASGMCHQPMWCRKWPPTLTLNPEDIALYLNCSDWLLYILCKLFYTAVLNARLDALCVHECVQSDMQMFNSWLIGEVLASNIYCMYAKNKTLWIYSESIFSVQAGNKKSKPKVSKLINPVFLSENCSPKTAKTNDWKKTKVSQQSIQNETAAILKLSKTSDLLHVTQMFCGWNCGEVIKITTIDNVSIQ